MHSIWSYNYYCYFCKHNVFVYYTLFSLGIMSVGLECKQTLMISQPLTKQLLLFVCTVLKQ